VPDQHGEGPVRLRLPLFVSKKRRSEGASFTAMTNPISTRLQGFPPSQTPVFESRLVAKLVGKLDELAVLYPARVP
jgi:hypothetical protein